MDAGAGHHADRAAVPRPPHLARHVVPVAPEGYTPQVPVHRAAERDEAAIATWRELTWVKLRGGGDRGVFVLRRQGRAVPAAPEGPHLGPPRLHAGGRSIRERLRAASVAEMICYRPSARSRLFYRIRLHTCHKGERRSLSEADYAELVITAHQQLHAPVILCWDNLEYTTRRCYLRMEVKDRPSSCLERRAKLEAVWIGDGQKGREQPRQSRAGLAPPDGPGAVSKTGRYKRGSGVVAPLDVPPAQTPRIWVGVRRAPALHEGGELLSRFLGPGMGGHGELAAASPCDSAG